MNILWSIGLGLLLSSLLPLQTNGAEKCQHCHQEEQRFSPFHDPQQIGCVSCHRGNPDSENESEAHQEMEAYPGNMKTATISCGQSNCHQDLVPLVENSIMHTLDGMITVTRKIFQEQKEDPKEVKTSIHHRLSEDGADSYLRKLCVSCHLGTERQNHQQSLRDRGGGCAACHLQTYPAKQKAPLSGKIHPRLSVRIHNDRCFGCHSRSSRISLNYVGLAETEKTDPARIQDFGYLPDKRLVEKKPPDLHSLAGMSCIDCHTANGLMGTGKRVGRMQEQLDIQCTDCHRLPLQKKTVQTLTKREAIYASLYPGQYHVSETGKVFVTEKQQSPLFHIEKKGEKYLLHKKLSRQKIEIPMMQEGLHHSLTGHERLNCDSCHADWAPQCYGCHIAYDPQKTQWDHLLRRKTKGKWTETRWYVRSESPALGVTANNKITTFVPGMNLILEKEKGLPPIIHQLYSQTSPHTTIKKGRSCKSCHQSESALGTITGWAIAPQNPDWKTPIGWIEKGQKQPGKAVQEGARSFNQQEIQRIITVGKCLACHDSKDPIYQDYPNSLNQIDAKHLVLSGKKS